MFGLLFAPNTAVPLGEGQGTLLNFCLVMLVQTFRAPLRLFISLTPLPFSGNSTLHGDSYFCSKVVFTTLLLLVIPNDYLMGWVWIYFFMKIHIKNFCHLSCGERRWGGGTVRGSLIPYYVQSKVAWVSGMIFFQNFLHSTGDFSHLTFNYLQSLTFLAERLWFVNHIIFVSSFNLSFG